MNFSAEDSSRNASAHSTDVLGSLGISVVFCNFLFGIPAHSYVLRLIYTRKSFAAEMFYINLTVCELISCLNNGLYILAIYRSELIAITQFLLGLLFTGRPVFQCLMCVERFLAVVHPVTFLKLKPLKYRIFCCSVAWTFSLGSCVYYFVFMLLYTDYSHTWYFSIQFFIFLFVQMFCCVSVLRALKQSGPGERKEESHRKRRAFYLILVTTVNMTVTFVPYIIAGFITALTKQMVYVLWLVAAFLYSLAGFVQPILYLYQAGKLSRFRCS